MKLTNLVLEEAASFISPTGARTLSLRELNLTSLDTISTLQASDIHSIIDLSNNKISFIETFPRLLHLNVLLLANNHIKRISGLKNLINLEVLSISFNEILYLSDLEELTHLPNLRGLYLNGNPIIKNKNYRLWCIWRFPSLQVLDFQRVTSVERKLATEKFKDATLVQSILTIGSHRTLNDSDMGSNQTHVLSNEDRQRLEEDLMNAESLEEIQRLEEILNSGKL